MKRSSSRIIAAAVGTACLTAVVISSCTKDKGVLPKQEPVVQPDECDTVTFAKHINPLIQAKCISCHGTTPSGNNVKLTSYGEVKTVSDNGLLYSVIITGPKWMPYGSASGLPQNEKDLVACWISNGEKQ